MSAETPPHGRRALSTTWERSVRRTAMWIALATAVLLSGFAFALARRGVPLWVTLPSAVALGLLLHRILTRRLRRRRAILAQPFPREWEAVLQREVAFYRALPDDDRGQFRRELQVFLGEKRITGIGMQLDTTTRVLVGASAIIPIFAFPEWEWTQIHEVLVYPDRFDEEFSFGRPGGRHTLGVVGSGVLNRVMILSQPDLLAGFRNPGDKHNVGLHEFAHLVDKSDGVADGIPAVGLGRASIGPWIELVRREMEQMARGRSDLDPYGLKSEAEFFAVATEYFFERPGVMQRRHPALFAMLARVFHQNPGRLVTAMAREVRRGRPRLGRNSPCPCGSGRKFKKCCLDPTRRAT